MLHAFTGGSTDGDEPEARPLLDQADNLHGTAYFGGSANDGEAFAFAPGNSKYSVLHSFCSQSGCTDGSQPAAAVSLDASGKLFGTTGRGGGAGYGTIFEIAKGSFKSLYSFCVLSGCSDGGYPYGTLALDAKGCIYGTIKYGGARDLGEVYRLTH